MLEANSMVTENGLKSMAGWIVDEDATTLSVKQKDASCACGRRTPLVNGISKMLQVTRSSARDDWDRDCIGNTADQFDVIPVPCSVTII